MTLRAFRFPDPAAAVACAALLALGGCDATTMLGSAAISTVVFGGDTGRSWLPIEDWDSVPARKEPVASKVTLTHAVRFAPEEDRLVAAERQRIDDFLARAEVGYGDRLVLVPPNDAGANGRRVQMVAAYLAMRQLSARVASPRPRAATPVEGEVDLVMERHVVTLPPCPDWRSPPGNTFNNTPHSNFGCATASNLGLMVADPGQLVEGHAYAPIDGTYGVLAIQRYQKGETRPLELEDVGVVQSQQKQSSGSGATP